MEIIPAIDLRAGRCVRLYQGDYDRETVYSDDPVRVALEWQEMGAPRIHLVDLDGAASGVQANLDVVRRIANAVDAPIQLGGGIRSVSAAESILDMGVQRIILGTSAVETPSFVEQACRRFGADAVIVGVDAKDGMVAVRGWRETSSTSALDLIHSMAALGVKRFIYTDHRQRRDPVLAELQRHRSNCTGMRQLSGGLRGGILSGAHPEAGLPGPGGSHRRQGPVLGGHRLERGGLQCISRGSRINYRT